MNIYIYIVIINSTILPPVDNNNLGVKFSLKLYFKLVHFSMTYVI